MIFKTKKGKYQLSFLILVRAQGLALPPLCSFAKAHRRPKVRLSLVVEPFLQCSLPYCAKKQKTPIRESFFVLVRAQGLALPPLCSFAKAHRRPKVRLSLVVEPFLQGSLPYRAKNKKNSRLGAFPFWYARRDWLCRHCAHSLKLTGVLKSAFRLWSNPFSSVLSLTALKTKKLPFGSFSVLVRAQGFEPWTH